MGSPSDERGRLDGYDWPLHEVTLTQAFYLGKYETTQAQWEAVMGSNPSTDSKKARLYGTYGVGDDYPVYYVSWYDCQTFIERLNGMGLGTFRMPTEAEWEYACRAGTDTRFSFGDALECDDVKSYCALMDGYMWWGGNNNPNGTKRIGLKLPNPWGLYDMHGNVWELCSDRWEDSFSCGRQVDPQGAATGNARVMRGGYWRYDAQYSRSAFRSRHSPGDRYKSIGFRLVREYP